jgi:hypothetical protein
MQMRKERRSFDPQMRTAPPDLLLLWWVLSVCLQICVIGRLPSWELAAYLPGGCGMPVIDRDCSAAGGLSCWARVEEGWMEGGGGGGYKDPAFPPAGQF